MIYISILLGESVGKSKKKSLGIEKTVKKPPPWESDERVPSLFFPGRLFGIGRDPRSTSRLFYSPHGRPEWSGCVH